MLQNRIYIILVVMMLMIAPMVLAKPSVKLKDRSDVEQNINSSQYWDDLDTPASIFLNDLGNTNVLTPNDDEILSWDAGTNMWIAAVDAGGNASWNETYANDLYSPINWNPFNQSLNTTDNVYFKTLGVNVSNPRWVFETDGHANISGALKVDYMRVGTQSVFEPNSIIVGTSGDYPDVQVKQGEYRFYGDSDTGMFAAGGIDKLKVTAGGTGSQIRLWDSSAQFIDFSVGGVKQMNIDTDGVIISNSLNVTGDVVIGNGSLNNSLGIPLSVMSETYYLKANISAGGIFEFDGDGDYIQLPESQSLNGTGSHTIMGWAKSDNPTVTGIVFSKGSDNPPFAHPDGWGMSLSYSNGIYWVAVVTTSPAVVQYNVNYGTTDADWHFLAGVFNNVTKNLSLYVDGVIVNSSSTGSTLRTHNPSLIGASAATGLTWNGSLDEVMIFNKSLSSGVVSEIYNLTKDFNYTYNGTDSEYLVSEWKADDGTAGDEMGLNDGDFKNDTYVETNSYIVTYHYNVSIWSEGNISATGYITRTSVFDNQYDPFDFIKDADYYKDGDEIDHSKFYGYTQTSMNGVVEEGVELGAEIDLLRQAVYELNERVTYLEKNCVIQK